MNKKQITVAVVILALAGFAAYLLRDWLKPAPIQIECLVRKAQPSRPSRRPQSALDAPSGKAGYNVTFALSRKAPLTSVKVFALEDVLTNKYPHALWNLVCPSNPVPTRSLVYGSWVRGLQPATKGVDAEQLEPGKSYRVVVEAEGMGAQQDFKVPL